VHADLTLTLGLPKRGLVEPRAIEHVGTVDVVDIGIPEELAGKIESDLDMIAAGDARRYLPPRPRASHKGVYGHVLIVAGAAGYAGAAILAARAAVRSGAGLVTVLTPECVAPVVAASVPEAMVHAGRQTDSGSLSGEALVRWGRALETFDAILLGPGMTTHAGTQQLVHELLASWKRPLVLDADALNVLEGDVDRLRGAAGPVVMTPHPGEMARMVGSTVEAVQARRFDVVREAVARLGGVMVLKGAGTVVGTAGQPLSVNLTGNPGMARGGMGDVLAGLLAGFVAQRVSPFDAARLAVFLHGRAADRVSWTSSQAGMCAGDVVDALAQSFTHLTPR
jgi:NAD(P)H-hydrate epimerase